MFQYLDFQSMIIVDSNRQKMLIEKKTGDNFLKL